MAFKKSLCALTIAAAVSAAFSVFAEDQGFRGKLDFDPRAIKSDGTVDFSVLEQKFSLTDQDALYVDLSEEMIRSIKEDGVSPDVAYEKYLREIEKRKAQAISPTSDVPVSQRKLMQAEIEEEKQALLQAIEEAQKRQNELFDPNSLAMKEAEAALALSAMSNSGLVEQTGRANEESFKQGEIPEPPDLEQRKQQMQTEPLSVFGLQMAIFVSRSMPLVELIDALRAAKESNAAVVFKGVLPGERIEDLSRWLFANTPDDLKRKMPTVTLNPVLFEEAQIKTVPSIGFVTQQANPASNQKSKWFVMSGTLNGEYAFKALKDEPSGQVVGPVYDITEEDMLAVFKDRMEKYDWEKAKKGALERYWTNLPKYKFAQAEKGSVRIKNPTVVNTEDVPGAYGETILKKGTKVNPLDIVPVKKQIVIFNATEENEVKAVDRYVKGEIMKGHQPGNFVFITTAIDRSNGKEWWGRFFGIAYEIVGQPIAVYYYQPNMTKVWDVRATPTIVRAVNRNYEIEELAVAQNGKSEVSR